MDLGQVKLTVTSCLLSEGNVDHAMVHQLCQGREVGGFLANQPTCAIKEGFHLGWHHAKTGWHSIMFGMPTRFGMMPAQMKAESGSSCLTP